MHEAAAEAYVVDAAGPRKRVRHLHLMTEEISDARLPDREWHGTTPRVSRRKRSRFPQCDGVAIQIGCSRFVNELRVQDSRVIGLRGPRRTRIPSGDAWRIGAAD